MVGALLIAAHDHRLCLRSEQASNSELESVWDRRGKRVNFRIADQSFVTSPAFLLRGNESLGLLAQVKKFRIGPRFRR